MPGELGEENRCTGKLTMRSGWNPDNQAILQEPTEETVKPGLFSKNSFSVPSVPSCEKQFYFPNSSWFHEGNFTARAPRRRPATPRCAARPRPGAGRRA